MLTLEILVVLIFSIIILALILKIQKAVKEVAQLVGRVVLKGNVLFVMRYCCVYD